MNSGIQLDLRLPMLWPSFTIWIIFQCPRFHCIIIFIVFFYIGSQINSMLSSYRDYKSTFPQEYFSIFASQYGQTICGNFPQAASQYGQSVGGNFSQAASQYGQTIGGSFHKQPHNMVKVLVETFLKARGCPWKPEPLHRYPSQNVNGTHGK